MKYLFTKSWCLPLSACALTIILNFAWVQAHNQSIIYKQSVKNKTKIIDWHCSSSGNFIISTVSGQSKKRTLESGMLKISVKNNQLLINGIKAGVFQISIVADNETIEVDGQSYKGVLSIELANHVLLVTYTPFTNDDNIKNAVMHDNLVTIKKEKNYYVRVLLSETSSHDGADWLLAHQGGFFIGDKHDTKNKNFLSDSQLHINSTATSIIINGKKYAGNHLCIAPNNGPIYFNDQAYDGTFSIVFHKGQRLLVNTLCIEEYVCSVLRSESWPGWPLEVNKAFAIASRSYVLAMVIRAQASKLPYHITNTSVHQNYKGVHTNKILHEAVDQTRGVFLAYDNKPIIAMFDGCCGGVVPAKISDFDFLKAPYLARTYPCDYCKSCSLYQWQAEYSLHDLDLLIGVPFSSSHKIRQVNIVKKDKAGLVSQISVKGAKHSILLTGQRFYSLLKKVKSYCFSIIKKDNKLIFKGRGAGHHLGICQWGAREMVRVGKGYKDILIFYYPGTEFACLS